MAAQRATTSSMSSTANMMRAAAAGARSFVGLRYGPGSNDGAAQARDKVLTALDRLEAELGSEDSYLVGDRFGAADLTAAALFYPLVLPAEGPRVLSKAPAELERFRAPLKDRRGFRWVEEIYARHRRPATVGAAQ